MNNTKTTLFVSFAAEDASLARKLKEWIEGIFPDRCEVFVSAAQESLPAGSEWFAEIRKALKVAQCLICLLGPRSRQRPWIYFESGAVWLQEKPIIPVLHSGLRSENLGAPLAQLQALTLSDEEFSKNLFSRVGKACGLGRVPRYDRREFKTEIEAALKDIRGPREVVSRWNEALRLGHVEVAESLTSKTALDYIRNRVGSLQALSKKYQQGGMIKDIHEHEFIDTESAKVVYTTVYADDTVRQWEDIVLLEEGEWRIAPQYVVVRDLRPKTGSTQSLRTRPTGHGKKPPHP